MDSPYITSIQQTGWDSMLFCSVVSGQSQLSLRQLPKKSTLTVVHIDVSTTAVSDQAFIPVSRRSLNETNAPTICTSPRIKRTTAHTCLSLACIGEGGCRPGMGCLLSSDVVQWWYSSNTFALSLSGDHWRRRAVERMRWGQQPAKEDRRHRGSE